MFKRKRRGEPDPDQSIGLPSGAACHRCNGDRQGDNVSGGWLLHFRHVNGGWYAFARCCPDCTWGAFRQRCTGQAIYSQFDADIREIGMFQSCLKPGMTLSQSAAKMPDGPPRVRFATQAATIEGTERGGWQQYNQPALPAGDVGF